MLFSLLEEYFVLRGLWYEGPKAGLAWLGQNDTAALRCFEKALAPSARIGEVEKLVALVAA